MARDRPEPLIFTAWMAELDKAILGDKLGDLVRGPMRRGTCVDGVRLMAPTASQWCDDTRTTEIETCRAQINEAPGAPPSTSSPPPMRAQSCGLALGRRAPGALQPSNCSIAFRSCATSSDDPIATDGDDTTVNRATPQGGFRLRRLPDVHGAGLRAIFDLADLDRSRFIIAGGQSGNPLSAHYRDQVERWRDGRYNRSCAAEGEEVLTLVPSAQ